MWPAGRAGRVRRVRQRQQILEHVRRSWPDGRVEERGQIGRRVDVQRQTWAPQQSSGCSAFVTETHVAIDARWPERRHDDIRWSQQKSVRAASIAARGDHNRSRCAPTASDELLQVSNREQRHIAGQNDHRGSASCARRENTAAHRGIHAFRGRVLDDQRAMNDCRIVDDRDDALRREGNSRGEDVCEHRGGQAASIDRLEHASEARFRTVTDPRYHYHPDGVGHPFSLRNMHLLG